MKMTRVCLVTETYRPEINGVANTLGYWVEGMKARGLRVQIIRPKQDTNDLDSTSNLEEQITVPGLPIPGYKELKFGLPQHRKIRKLWKKEKPEAVYIATEGPLGWSAARVARELGIPVLSGFHTNFQSYSRFYKLGWLESLIYSYLRHFHNLTKGTIVPTLKQRNELSSAGFKNVSVLSRGVDCQKFRPNHRSSSLRSAWGADSSTTVYLYVGRIAGEKNVGLIGKLYTKLRTEAAPKSKIVFVGDGPLKRSMEQEYPGIVFSGMKTGLELAQHYASADVFLFPSKTDTFGNVVTEAMASELAIVSFDDAAAREHLSHKESAYLAPIDDDQAFINYALNLNTQSRTVKAFRSKAHHLSQHISWNSIVDKFIEKLLDDPIPQYNKALGGQNHGDAKNIRIAPQD